MSQHSLGDGMPDIHMVESTMSLLSNMSIMTTSGDNTSVGPTNSDPKSRGVGAYSSRGSSSTAAASAAAAAAASNPDEPYRPPYAPPQIETVKVVDHSSRDIHWGGLGGESKHSVMSGLSRIDDESLGGGSVFEEENTGKKDISTRSIAMSELSALDMRERDNEDDDGDDVESDPRKLKSEYNL